MNKTKILVWVIIILVVINITTIITVVSFSSGNRDAGTEQPEVSFTRRTDFFQTQLGLNQEQRKEFMLFNRKFNQAAGPITERLNTLRFKMIDELSSPAPDTVALNRMCRQFGNLHYRLKNVTVNYYLNMKSVCDKNQEIILSDLFRDILESDGNIDRMRAGRGMQGRQQRGIRGMPGGRPPRNGPGSQGRYQ